MLQAKKKTTTTNKTNCVLLWIYGLLFCMWGVILLAEAPLSSEGHHAGTNHDCWGFNVMIHLFVLTWFHLVSVVTVMIIVCVVKLCPPRTSVLLLVGRWCCRVNVDLSFVHISAYNMSGKPWLLLLASTREIDSCASHVKRGSGRSARCPRIEQQTVQDAAR